MTMPFSKELQERAIKCYCTSNLGPESMYLQYQKVARCGKPWLVIAHFEHDACYLYLCFLHILKAVSWFYFWLRCTCPCCWLDKTVPRYPKAQVQVSDIPNVLKLAHDLLGPDVADITSAVARHGSRALDLFFVPHSITWISFLLPLPFSPSFDTI